MTFFPMPITWVMAEFPYGGQYAARARITKFWKELEKDPERENTTFVQPCKNEILLKYYNFGRGPIGKNHTIPQLEMLRGCSRNRQSRCFTRTGCALAFPEKLIDWGSTDKGQGMTSCQRLIHLLMTPACTADVRSHNYEQLEVCSSIEKDTCAS